jgi:anti-sigma regulatory factor (Ser/Thr protein kinase)
VTAGQDRFTLELPRDAAFMATARMFASSLARHFEIEEDVVEDLKLAISEACSRALAADDADLPVSLRVARDDGRLLFEISQGDLPPAEEEDTPAPSHEQMGAAMSLELITALFDDAVIATDPQGRPVLRFSVA